MGYFLGFLFLHFSLRHRFVPTGFKVLDWARQIFLFAFITLWSVAVAYSRCVLASSYLLVPTEPTHALVLF